MPVARRQKQTPEIVFFFPSAFHRLARVMEQCLTGLYRFIRVYKSIVLDGHTAFYHYIAIPESSSDARS